MKKLHAGRRLLAAVRCRAWGLGLGVSVAGAHNNDLGFDSIVSGLGNPRGIAFDDHGKVLYVAESGDAGTLCLDATTCVGLTSKITKVNVKGRDDEPVRHGPAVGRRQHRHLLHRRDGRCRERRQGYAFMGLNPTARRLLRSVAGARTASTQSRLPRTSVGCCALTVRATSSGSRTSARSISNGRPTTTRPSRWMAGKAARCSRPIAAAPAIRTSTPATRTRTRWPPGKTGTTWSTAARIRSPGCCATAIQACWPRCRTRLREAMHMTPCRRAWRR